MNFEQESIKLSLWKRVGTFLIHWVLGGHHKEERRQGIGFASDGHLALLHCFKQGSLDFCRSAVDFIGKDQFVENWPRLERQLTLI